MRSNNSKQDELRKKAKIALVENQGTFTTKDFAEMLNINIGSYYNWISGAYDLCSKKARQFEGFLNDILY